MHPRCASGVVPLLLAVVLAAQDEPAPVLDRGTFAELWEHVVPKADELAWQRIAWHGTLAAGVVQAHASDRPILLWAMNGHPLACT